MTRRRIFFGFVGGGLAGLTLCLVAGSAQAAVDINDAPDVILNIFEQNTRSWQSALKGLAEGLFWLLVKIEIAWTAGRMVVRGADMGEWLSEFLNQILYIGFFYWLLEYAPQLASIVIASFQQAAERAAQTSPFMGSGTADPTGILITGLNAGFRIMKLGSGLTPGEIMPMEAVALMVVSSFAMMAAFLIVVMVESYIVISAGVLMMGFGGSNFTRHYATAYARYAVSIGAKLFMIQLIAILGQRVFQEFNFMQTDDMAEAYKVMFIMAAVAFVLSFLTFNIPSMVGGLLTGNSQTSPHDLSHMGGRFHEASRMAGGEGGGAGGGGRGRHAGSGRGGNLLQAAISGALGGGEGGKTLGSMMFGDKRQGGAGTGSGQQSGGRQKNRTGGHMTGADAQTKASNSPPAGRGERGERGERGGTTGAPRDTGGGHNSSDGHQTMDGEKASTFWGEGRVETHGAGMSVVENGPAENHGSHNKLGGGGGSDLNTGGKHSSTASQTPSKEHTREIPNNDKPKTK